MASRALVWGAPGANKLCRGRRCRLAARESRSHAPGGVRGRHGVVVVGAARLHASPVNRRPARRFSIRPELVFRTAFHKLKNSQVVVDAIGAPVKAGALRAYTIQQGHMAFCADNSLKWVSPRVQMLFALEGSQHSAMVSLEAETVNGALNFTLLTVDVLGAKQNAPPLVVEGLQDRLEVRGQLRGFLQSERVRYIEQTKPSPEEVEVGIGSQHPRA